ncbi:HAMP domain-containing sensor histidine kinase [Alteromonas sp. CI.11.F.A3]|uniref:sensor histidine kinase n=1 Tax=Alteromonas sp. CI.11.F.A3 TaxID=3079555 RepID=UPI002942BE4C|nr:HAMP domain-containing sensor histidine kinase [Alteromonas sp. CI.11.F.A3]WOI38419.1 HAMP domain-containing sensor histidine kinase [Alteromonas sp. CI.11.F.A3]
MLAIGNFTRSSSFRVGVLLTSLALVAILFIVYFWRLASSDVFIREASAAVDAETYAFTLLHEQAGIEAVISNIQTRAVSNVTTDSNKSDTSHFFTPARLIVVLRDSDNKIIAGNYPLWPIAMVTSVDSGTPSASIIELPPLIESNGNSQQSSITTEDANYSFSESTNSILFERVNLEGYSLFVGRNIDDLYSAQWLGKTFGWIIIALLSVLGAISFAVALYVVKRINRMAQTADYIIRTGNLEERLEIDSSWDDLSRLAVVFNHMLDTIESAVNNIKSVSDSIAHDLRTPLARLRNNLEHIDDEKLRHDTTYEADKLLNMFNSLLRISKLETVHKKEGFCETELSDMVTDVEDLYQPLAEDRDIKLISQLSNIQFYGDPNLLFQAVANVLDNAIKYTPDGGTVTLQLTATSSHVIISVNDNGKGVDEHELDSLERRFFQADKSRTCEGNGLGLSLVSAIIKLHKGKLWFVHDPLMQGHGLGVVFTFPRYHR